MKHRGESCCSNGGSAADCGPPRGPWPGAQAVPASEPTAHHGKVQNGIRVLAAAAGQLCRAMVLPIPVPHVLIDLLAVFPVPCTRFSSSFDSMSSFVNGVQFATGLGVSLTLGVSLCKILLPEDRHGSG